MEESKSNPEGNRIETFPELEKERKKEENVKAFSEFLENANNQESKEEIVNSDLKSEKSKTNDNSILIRILNNGIDGISSNPNFKMLALLVILFINLSLFLVIGNLGKAFLRNAGLMWLIIIYFSNMNFT